MVLKRSIEKEMNKLGYKGYHLQRELPRGSSEMELESKAQSQSDSIFYKSDRIEVIEKEEIRINEQAKDKMFESALGPLKSEFRASLVSHFDALIALHCRLKHKWDFVAATTHLYWDPRFPEVKAAQAFLLSHSLFHVITYKWNLDSGSIPLVVGLDANSLPFKDQQDKYHPILPKGVCFFII
ncbi:protein angel [Reticulomyxa filosa]|uniref:Protein angel n=1 Tax=Reticulomyxa filosa TaxID=46433 RepID=X6LSP4_RETFI|nr:protein angel [Reticulomyxa filosa]|eukprot:ETO03775.1 protein angel [Reticulomyxa filosa]